MRIGKQPAEQQFILAAQAPALDALATWLVEDTARLEPRLLGRDVTNRFVALLAAYTPCCAPSAALVKPVRIPLCGDCMAMSSLTGMCDRPPTPKEPQIKQLALYQRNGATLLLCLYIRFNTRAAGCAEVATVLLLCAAPDETETLVQLLGPLVRMVRVSPRLAVALGQAGLPALLVRLLHAPTALTALPLLQLLRSVYEHHPRPKVSVPR